MTACVASSLPGHAYNIYGNAVVIQGGPGPVASDLPMIDAVLVEVPNPAHPYGAKRVGEVNICPPMAAIANAIDRAIGYRMTDL